MIFILFFQPFEFTRQKWLRLDICNENVDFWRENSNIFKLENKPSSLRSHCCILETFCVIFNHCEMYSFVFCSAIDRPWPFVEL